MRRSCGCPYGETKPESSKPSDWHKVLAGIPRRETRAPLKEIQNNAVYDDQPKKVPTATVRKTVSTSTNASEPKLPKNVETQTSITISEASNLSNSARSKSTSTEVPSFDLVPSAKSTPSNTPSTLRATSLAASTKTLPSTTQEKGEEKSLAKHTIISIVPNTVRLESIFEENSKIPDELVNKQRQYPTPANISSVLSSNSGFIPASEFFKSLEKCVKSSPILPTLESKSDVLLTQFENKPNKKTLIKAKRRRLARYSDSLPYSCDIFSTDYLPEIMEHLMKKDQEYVVKRNFFYNNNKHFNSKHRSIIFDWILSAQDELELNNSIYFMIVRLLDNILAIITIPYNMLQLVSLVTYWIIIKIHGTTIPNARKLSFACANIYSVKEILRMEMKVLKLLEFRLDVSTPYDFFNCLLKLASIPQNHGFSYCIEYILEVFSFNQRFSCFTSCEIASAATYLAAIYFEWDLKSRIKPGSVLSDYRDVADIVLLMDVQMKRQYTTSLKYEYGVYKRYSSIQYLKVAIEIQQRVSNTKI